jgi:hypothetical protein
MTRLPCRFLEDRALRDAARAVLAEDIARVRSALEEEGIASRVSSGVTATISGRIRAGARDVMSQAKARAGDHKGVLAVLVGLIVLWLARGPILDWMAELDAIDTAEDDTDDETATDAASPGAASEGNPA